MKRAPSSAKVFLLTPRESKNLIFSSEATFSANKGQVVKTNVIAPFGKHYSLVFESNEGEYLVHACTSNPLPSASSSEVVSDTIFAMEPILRRVSPILDHFLSCSNNKVYFLSFFSQFVSAQERIEAARWLNYAVPTKKVSPLATGAFKVSDIRCNGEKGMQCLNAHGYRISKGDSLYKKVDFHLAQKLTQDRYFEAANLGGISPALAEVQRIANQEGLSSYVDESDLLNEEPFSLADLCRLATILIKKEHVTFMKAVNSPLFTATDQILGEFLRREALARDAKVGAVDGGFPIVRGAAGGKRGGESLSLTETVWSEKLSPASAPSCCSPFPDLVHWQECAPWLDPPGLRRGLAAAMEGAVSGFRSAVGGFFSAFPDLGGVLALPSFLPFLFLGWLFGVAAFAPRRGGGAFSVFFGAALLAYTSPLPLRISPFSLFGHAPPAPLEGVFALSLPSFLLVSGFFGPSRGGRSAFGLGLCDGCGGGDSCGCGLGAV